MAYDHRMEFIETLYFSELLQNYLTDDEYRQLQLLLIEQPDRGAIIQGTGGVRKIRFKMGNKGKRGGVRIIYYWISRKFRIYFLTIYAKCSQEDLSPQEKSVLYNLAKELNNHG